ncbi:phage tail tape measure protein [Phenylobacterium sp. VNQ135]|uniref:phage tail tape measure protein n=1 Tax=Phenylobacterium sp. VNQ135 TaxID=3400922 RepID=UPI003BFF7915
MSADPADLIMRAMVEGGREAANDLDRIAANANKAERATDNLSSSESRLERQLRQADLALSQQNKTLSHLTRVSGRAGTAMLGLAAGIAAGAAGAVAASLSLQQLAADTLAFKAAMDEVSTLVDTSTFSMRHLEKAALDQARAFNSTPVEQTKALYQIISAGATSAAKATEILTAANKLAVGGVTDIRTAADGLTSVLNAYGSKVESAAAVSDAMFTAVRAGKTTIAELSASLGQVAPLAAQMGVSFDELTAATAALTKGGISTSVAVTGLRAILAAVADPADDARKLAKALGLEFSAAALETKGLAGFLADLQAKTGGNTAALSKLFGGVEALVPVMALMGQAGVDLTAILGQMEQKTGATDEAFEKIAAGSGYQLNLLFGDLKIGALELGIAVSESLTPAIVEARGMMAELARSELAQAIGVGLGGAFKVVEVAVGGTIYVVGQLLRLLGATVATAAALARLDFSAVGRIGESFRKDWDAAAQSYGRIVSQQLRGQKATEDLTAATDAAAAATRAATGVNTAASAAAQRAATSLDQQAEKTRKAKAETDKLAQALKGVNEALETDGERALRIAHEQMVTLRANLDKGAISGDEYREKMDRIWRSLEAVTEKQKAWNPELTETITKLNEGAKRIETLDDRVRALADAFSEVRFSIDDMFRSLKSGDIGGFLMNIQGLISGVGSLLQQGPAGLLSLGSIAANAIGGRGGRAIGGGLGIAAGGLGIGAFAGTSAGAAALGSIGLGGLASSIAAVAGPIGLAAGALYAAAKLLNVGGKPSNKGAGFDLITGAISGNKRDEDTENAARSAGEAIRGIQEALKAAGIGLTDAVTGLVIGTRDQTQIYLQSGRELRSAVGDSGAAVDTAMRALLESATYVSDAQKGLVDSALAAGKGFDAVQEILAKWEAAQGISKSLADEILRLTDPKAFDLEAVRRDMEEQRKAAAQLAKDGYLTAEQLATINDQLATLEGLRLDEVLKRYADAVTEVTFDLARDQEWAAGQVASAQDALVQAYEREAAVHREAVDRYRQIADGLRSFNRELQGMAATNPVAQYRLAKSEFERINALAADDPERLANLERVGRAFAEASKVASPTELAFNRDIQAVRRATEASEIAAQHQADKAQQQLDALTTQVELLVQLNVGVMTVAQAIANLQSALAVQQQLGGAANDNIDVTRYLANNPDLAANWMAGGIMRQLGGSLEEAAREHYRRTGKDEIAGGLRYYAAGGWHPGGVRMVGEEGPEIEATGPARYYSARDTAKMLGGDNSEVVAELRAVRAELAALRKERSEDARQIKRNTKDSADTLARVEKGTGVLTTVAA